jgi:hypothetical protein
LSVEIRLKKSASAEGCNAAVAACHYVEWAAARSSGKRQRSALGLHRASALLLQLTEHLIEPLLLLYFMSA